MYIQIQKREILDSIERSLEKYLIFEAGNFLCQFCDTLSIFRLPNPCHHQVFFHSTFEVSIFALRFTNLTFKLGLIGAFILQRLSKVIGLFSLAFELIGNDLVLETI